MPKVFLENESIERVTAVELPFIKFFLNVPASDNINTSGTIKVALSATDDFASMTEYTPTQYQNTAGDVTLGNTVIPADFNKSLKCTILALGAQVVKYAKVMFVVGGITYQSPTILLSSLTQLNFITNPIDKFGQVKPIRVKVKDKINAILVGAAYTIKVEVCNNGLEAVPTWENATTAYTGDTFFTFTNVTKTAGNNWAIRVKYTITKANIKDIIEVTEVYVGFL